jgi:transposase-like protein
MLARGTWKCGKCRVMVSATAGTIFHRSHLSLRLWFRAIWLFTNQKTGLSALGLQRALGLGSYRTAWMCLHKLRRATVRQNRDQLSGKVEVDEIFVGGRRRRPGQGPGLGMTLGSKTIVATAVEVRDKGMGRVRFQIIPHRSHDHLTGFVKLAVAPASTIITDGWFPYTHVKDSGYIHEPRPGRAEDPESDPLLPHVHRVASLLKRWLLGVHQGRISREHLAHYLNEFAFRFNRRLSSHRGQLFYRLVQQASVVDPHPYSRLQISN